FTLYILSGLKGKRTIKHSSLPSLHIKFAIRKNTQNNTRKRGHRVGNGRGPGPSPPPMIETCGWRKC
ncbi:hypothetical protein NDU88_006748, partial [Pleurodeles waltl]